MKHKDIEVGEIAQMMALLDIAKDTGDKDGAIQVYNLIIYHLARKHNETLVLSLDEMLKDL